MTPLLITPLLAFAVAIALHLLALRVFPRLGLLDFPERYGLKRTPLPYPTGIISIAVFLMFSAILIPVSPQGVALIGSSILLAIVCVIDDRKRLSPVLRLAVHIAIGFWLFAAGIRIYSLTNPLETLTSIPILSLDSWTVSAGFLGSLPVLSGVFTIAWIILTTNALNWFDGIPGQTSALSTLGFLTIGLLSLSARVDQPAVALIALTLAGIACASLVFDFPPNRVVMGDTGSMFFGLLLGILTIYSGGKVATAFLVLGVPLLDLFFVVIRRLLKGKSPLRSNGNGEHLHHRLLAKGWNARQVILLTSALGLAFGLTALFLSTTGKFFAGIVLFVIMLGLSWYSRPTGRMPVLGG